MLSILVREVLTELASPVVAASKAAGAGEATAGASRPSAEAAVRDLSHHINVLKGVIEDIAAPVLGRKGAPEEHKQAGVAGAVPEERKPSYRKTVIVSPEEQEPGQLFDAIAAQAVRENKTLQGIVTRLQARFQDAVVNEAADQLFHAMTEPAGAAPGAVDSTEGVTPETPSMPSVEASVEATTTAAETVETVEEEADYEEVTLPARPSYEGIAVPTALQETTDTPASSEQGPEAFSVPPEPFEVTLQPLGDEIEEWIDTAPHEVTRLYVFGIIPTEEQAGVEAELREAGVSLRIVPHKATAALVGVIQPTSASQRQLLSRIITAGNTVLPVREGGIVMHGERDVVEMLTTHAVLLQQAFDYLRKEDEWVVQLHCNYETLQREVDQSDRRFESIIDSMVTTLRGRATLVARFHANTWAEAAIEVADSPSADLVENIIKNCQKFSHQILGTMADDSVISLEREGTLVLESAYLVPKENKDRFQHTLMDLQGKYGGLGFSYRSDGPQIPNRFAFRNRPRF